MEAYSQDAVEYAKRLKKDLDYSEESINEVEEICSLLHKAIPKNFLGKLFKKSPSEETILQMAKMLGGYIGEVIRKHYGGNWVIEDLMNEGNVLFLNTGDMKTFPVSKVYKRLKNGPEDNVFYYYYAMTKDLQKHA